MRRTAVLLLVMCMAAVSCSSDAPPRAGKRSGSYGDGLGDGNGAGDGGSTASKKKRNTRGEEPVPVGSRPGGQPTSRAAPPPPPPPATYSDNGIVGMNARDYLGDSRAKRLIVEVDFIEGKAPRRAALDHLQSILERETDKPKGVHVLQGNAMPRGDGSYSFEEIDAMEQRHRDRSSGGDTVTMWVAYLDGQLQGEAGTLGVAYRASSAALFPDRIRQATTAAVNATSIERAVLVHEVGHLLGLIELVYDSAHDRQDPASEGHSTESDSVMLAAVRDISVASVLAGGPPDDFNASDRDDLRGMREGRL